MTQLTSYSATHKLQQMQEAYTVQDCCCAVAEAKNKFLAYWFPLAATVALILAGTELTGPSMNPAIVRHVQLYVLA